LSRLPTVFPNIQISVVPHLGSPIEITRGEGLRLSIATRVFEALNRGDTRARYLVAHEIGHLALQHRVVHHKGHSPEVETGKRRSETEAEVFAREFLMPARIAQFQTVAELQKNFQVSPAAAAKRIVELKSSGELPLAPAARARADIVNELAAHGYSEEELSDLVVPKRTLARRRSGNELLTVEETDKALRLKRIAALAEQVFGNRAKAHRWMRKPKRSLSGEAPLAYLASENGARIVEEMLGRIEHGIYA
jgi:putative toxin-antitoxin system antitoxin component (TIGR02293 family)